MISFIGRFSKAPYSKLKIRWHREGIQQRVEETAWSNGEKEQSTQREVCMENLKVREDSK